MTIQELIKMLKAVRDEKPFKVSYRLLKDGRLSRFYGENYGTVLITLLEEVADSEPPLYGEEVG